MRKRGCLGCSFPLLVGVIVIFLGLFVVGFLSGSIGRQLFPNLQMPSWIIVAQPHPSLPSHTVFELFGFHVTNSILAAWISMVVLVVLSVAATRRMKIVPAGVQNFLEMVLGWLYNFCKEVAGEKNGRRFFPIVTTIFLFVITNAWLSLVPGFGTITILNPEGHLVELLKGANTDVNTPLAMAIVSFCAVGYFGFRSVGVRFLGQYFAFGRLFGSFGKIFRGNIKSGFGDLFFGVIDIVVGVLELLSVFIRIVSFTFRLFGNMTAGEILLLIVAFLVPWVLALPFYGLELLVGFVQALIFAGLTLVFATMAVVHHNSDAN